MTMDHGLGTDPGLGIHSCSNFTAARLRVVGGSATPAASMLTLDVLECEVIEVLNAVPTRQALLMEGAMWAQQDVGAHVNTSDHKAKQHGSWIINLDEAASYNFITLRSIYIPPYVPTSYVSAAGIGMGVKAYFKCSLFVLLLMATLARARHGGPEPLEAATAMKM